MLPAPGTPISSPSSSQTASLGHSTQSTFTQSSTLTAPPTLSRGASLRGRGRGAGRGQGNDLRQRPSRRRGQARDSRTGLVQINMDSFAVQTSTDTSVHTTSADAYAQTQATSSTATLGSTSQASTQEPPPSVTSASQTSTLTSSKCGGLRLPFAVGRTPIMDYPFALHTLDAPLWNWQLCGSTMFLIHLQCTGERDDGFRQGCCGRCWSLAKHPILPIVRSSTLGIPPLPLDTPLEHHSLNGLLERAKEQEAELRSLGIRYALLGDRLTRDSWARDPVDG